MLSRHHSKKFHLPDKIRLQEPLDKDLSHGQTKQMFARHTSIGLERWKSGEFQNILRLYASLFCTVKKTFKENSKKEFCFPIFSSKLSLLLSLHGSDLFDWFLSWKLVLGYLTECQHQITSAWCSNENRDSDKMSAVSDPCFYLFTSLTTLNNGESYRSLAARGDSSHNEEITSISLEKCYFVSVMLCI